MNNHSINYKGWKLPFVTVGPYDSCNYKTDGTADDIQWNQAITDLNGLGIIQGLPNITYGLANPLTIVGNSSWFTAGVPNRKLIIRGCGDSTLFNMSASNKNGIEISNNALVNLLNFKLRMPDTSSGNGIAGLSSGNNPVSVTNSYWNNIRVTGCDSTHSCIHLKNPFYLNIPNTYVNGNGNGVLLEATAGYNNGNSLFGIITAEYCLGGFAFGVQSLVNTATINLINLQHLNTYGSYKGLYLNAKNGGRVLDSTFSGLDLETSHQQIQVDIDSSSEITGHNFQADYVQLNAGQIAIDESPANDSHGGNNYKLNVMNDGSSVILSDAGNGYRYPNTYELLLKGSAGLGANQIVISGTQPKINWKGWDAGYYLMKNPNSGVATGLSSGGTIAHHIGKTPLWVLCQGKSYPISSYTFDGTNITPVWSGGSQTVCWRAGWNSD
jgi:hypothetical protein